MSAATSQVAGTKAIYTVHVENFGPNANVSYQVTAPFPGGGVSFDAGASDADCSVPVSDIVCTRSGGFASGDPDEFDIALKIPANYVNGLLPTLTRNLSFTATLTDTSPTQDPSDTDPNGATVDVPVHGEADLDITQTMSYVNPSTFTPQGAGNRHSVRYVVTVTNVGPSDAQNVTLADTFRAAHSMCLWRKSVPSSPALARRPSRTRTERRTRRVVRRHLPRPARSSGRSRRRSSRAYGIGRTRRTARRPPPPRPIRAPTWTTDPIGDQRDYDCPRCPYPRRG